MGVNASSAKIWSFRNSYNGTSENNLPSPILESILSAEMNENERNNMPGGHFRFREDPARDGLTS